MLKLERRLFKVIAMYLVIAVFSLSLPAPGWAMLVSADREALRTSDMVGIRTTLESSVIKQRLMDYGLTSEEAVQRIGSLSDEQVHQLASKIDAVQAGGDALGFVLAVVLITAIVIIVLELTGHKVVTR